MLSAACCISSRVWSMSASVLALDVSSLVRRFSSRVTSPVGFPSRSLLHSLRPPRYACPVPGHMRHETLAGQLCLESCGKPGSLVCHLIWDNWPAFGRVRCPARPAGCR